MTLVEVQTFGTGTRYVLEILYQCGKRVKTKSQEQTLRFSEVTEEKLVERAFLPPPPILNMVKDKRLYHVSLFLLVATE